MSGEWSITRNKVLPLHIHKLSNIMKNILLICRLVCVSVLWAGNQFTGIGARSAAMSHVSVAVSDMWSCANNQAALGFYKHMAAGVHYENRYLTSFTSVGAVGAVFPVPRVGVWSMELQLQGGGGYNCMQAGVAYSRAFGRYVAVGLQFDYLLHYFGEAYYGRVHGLTCELGVYGRVTPQLSLAFHAYNPFRLCMLGHKEEKEYIPTLLRMGLAYKLGSCMLAGELIKDMDTRMNVAVAVEYEFARCVSLRAGVRLPDFEFSTGLGCRVKGVEIDLSSSYHSVLGYSPQISMVYNIK